MFVEHKEVGEESNTKEPQRLAKLSQAIREGCKHHPQAFGQHFDGKGTCAMGAGAVGRGWVPNTKKRSGVYDFLPDCRPACLGLGGPIATMNDSGITREAIADWLEAQGL